MTNKKKIDKTMTASEILGFVTDNKVSVEVPGWNGRKIECERMTLAEMVSLKEMTKEDAEKAMLKKAFGFSDKDVEKLQSENDGLKMAQLIAALNEAYRVTDETVKK